MQWLVQGVCSVQIVLTLALAAIGDSVVAAYLFGHCFGFSATFARVQRARALCTVFNIAYLLSSLSCPAALIAALVRAGSASALVRHLPHHPMAGSLVGIGVLLVIASVLGAILAVYVLYRPLEMFRCAGSRPHLSEISRRSPGGDPSPASRPLTSSLALVSSFFSGSYGSVALDEEAADRRSEFGGRLRQDGRESLGVGSYCGNDVEMAFPTEEDIMPMEAWLTAGARASACSYSGVRGRIVVARYRPLRLWDILSTRALCRPRMHAGSWQLACTWPSLHLRTRPPIRCPGHDRVHAMPRERRAVFASPTPMHPTRTKYFQTWCLLPGYDIAL